MERYRVAASFTQRPTTFQTAPSLFSLLPKPHLREAPVSSYLRPELPRSASGLDRRIGRCPEDTEMNIFDAERYFNEGHDAIKRAIIFNGAAAERFDLSAHRRDSSFSSVDGYARHGGTCSFHSTPSATSEASWNSQSGLLSNRPGSAAVVVSALPLKEPSKSPSSAPLRLFGRNCPCSCVKSVDVEEKCSEPKSPIRSSFDLDALVTAKNSSFRTGEVGLSSIPERAMLDEINNEFNFEEIKVKVTPGNRPKNHSFFSSSTRFLPERTFPEEVGRRMVNSGSLFDDSDGFSFPILNSPSLNLADEPPRKSLDVFQPTKETPAGLSTPPELQRRAVVFPFSVEGDRRSFTFPAIPNPPPDDDVASDASSDLFEIETFSTQVTYRRCDSLDQLPRGLEEAAPPQPSIAPSECYAPSEASVEWSVTTAEGFDRASLANFSSAASDCGDLRFFQAESQRFAARTVRRRRRNGLLNCRSEKAVSVGPNPIRSDTGRRPMSRSVL